jgi:hypothetical protein
MRKWIILLSVTVALSMFGLLPAKSQEVSDLLPCQTLLVSRHGNVIQIAGDGGVQGTGADWDAAMDALFETAPGTLFLGTVSAVVFTDGASDLIPIVMEDRRLRPAARVLITDDGLTPDEADGITAFLKAHTAAPTLANLRTASAEGEARPEVRLYRMEGRYRLGQNVGPAAL